jgi:hypothetical protein
MRIFFLTLAALISTGLIVAAPDSLDDSLQNLRDAVAKKDAAQIKPLAVQTIEAANKITSGPAPETEIDKEQVNAARDAQSYAEYALYSTAIESEPDVKLDLFATLEQASPTSKYLNDGYVYYFQALTQAGDAAKIPAIAEKALKNLPSSPDVLAELLDLAAQKNQNDKALSYAQRLIGALGKRPKSEIMPDAEWLKKRNAMLGRAHMVAGVVLLGQTHNYRADQELRAALPLVRGDDLQTATVLFNLGLANYSLGSTGMNKAQVLEAARFSQQCAAIKSQYQEQAAHNATAMKNFAATMH